jgi:hypothetical protein
VNKENKMSELSMEELEELEGQAEIWRQEERESPEYKRLIALARSGLNRDRRQTSTHLFTMEE